MVIINIVEKKKYKNQELVKVRISTSSGSYVELTNIGASIVSICVPDKYGKLDNVVLSYDTLEEYIDDKFYLGSTVGRFANRISDASFSLEGVEYLLDKNDGENSNHGGFNGFNSRVFDYQIGEDCVKFKLLSEAGEGGFPGNLRLEVIYRFGTDDNLLSIEYKSISDTITPINLTNHSYFNLGGFKSDTWMHQLQINSSTHLEMTDDFLPTGKKMPVADTAFDFRSFSSIGAKACMKTDGMKGFNAFYEQQENINGSEPIAILKEVNSGRCVELRTNMSGVQLYTGDFLSSPFQPFQGVCLEAQYHPDGLKYSDFKKCILQANVEDKEMIHYLFYTEVKS